jgi:DNA-binding transcriptional ArsR family regulator
MSKIEKFAEMFKALSDPTRLRLIGLLSKGAPPDIAVEGAVCQGGPLCEGSPLCVNALASLVGVTQSAVSQHLRILRQAGLVRGTREGNFMHYEIDPDGIAKCKANFREALGEDIEIG